MLFNGKYYNKPGHLGMTRAELLEKLNGGGGGGATIIEKIGYDADNSFLLFYDAGAVIETPDGHGETFRGISESDYIRTKTFVETLGNALKTGSVYFYAPLTDDDNSIMYNCQYSLQKIAITPPNEYTLVNNVYDLPYLLEVTTASSSTTWTEYDGHYYLAISL